jgi:hypothetical protein
MSDSRNDSIAPVPPVSHAAPVQPVRNQRSAALPGNNTPAAPDRSVAAATTGGTLPAAYAQFVVNRDTHDVVIRIRDANTDRIIEEYPSPQVEELAKYMKAYVETARQRVAKQSSN